MIKTHDLTKKYGELYAIQSIELDLEKGDLFGFIGPNGAGKTTTMRIIATLLNPTWGEAYVCGNSIYTKPKEIRRLVGYMPDFFGVYDDMKVIEYLEFFAAAYRIKGEKRYRAVAGLSMGGGGSFMYALHRPDMFSSSVPLSAYQGPLTIEDFRDRLGSTDASDSEVEAYFNRHSALRLNRLGTRPCSG